jgi:hypothetical protein
MIRKGGLALLLGAACMLAGASALAQDAPADLTAIPPVPKSYKPKLTAWGEPDLSGLWPIDHLNQTPFQRTEAQGNRYWLTDEEYAAREKQIDAASEGVPAVYEAGGKEYVVFAVGGDGLFPPKLGQAKPGPNRYVAFALPGK